MSDAGGGAAPPESPERLSRRVLGSTLWNYVGYGSTLLTWFLLTPFVVAYLGNLEYGLFAIAVAFMGYAQLFELGMSNAVTKFVSELHERGETERLRSLVVTAYVIAVSLIAVATLGGLAFAPFAPGVFGVDEDLVQTTQRLMVVAGLSVGVAFPTSTLFAVLAGYQRFELVNMMHIASTLLLAGFTIAALVAGLDVVWIVAAGIPTSLIVAIPAFAAIRRIAPELRLLTARPRRSDAVRLLSFSWSLLFVQGAALIKGRTDEIVIGAALGPAKVTPYALARRASEAPGLLTAQFTKVIMPLAAQLGARDERDRLRGVYLNAARLTLASYLGFVVALVALAGAFLAAWVGEEYRSAGTVLAILMIAGSFEITTAAADAVLQGISRHRPLALFAILGAFLNLGLSIALVGRYGVLGVAVATLIASIVEVLVLTVPYTMRTLSTGPRTMLREVLVPVLLPVVPASAVAVGLHLVLPPASLPLVIGEAALIFCTYAGAYFAMGASPLERDLARQMLAALVRRVRPAP